MRRREDPGPKGTVHVDANANPCPTCAAPLEPYSTAHGIVWVCRACRGIAANLAVVRKIAPRLFVKHLWLAALESGAPSKPACPSCGRPLLALGPDVEISPSCKVCCRCFLVWFDHEALTFLRVAAPEIFPALSR